MEITKWAVSTTGVQTSTDPKAKQKQESKSAEEPAAPAAEEQSAETEQPAGDSEKKSWDPEV